MTGGTIHAIHCLRGKAVELQHARGRIVSIKDSAARRATSLFIGPGLTDLQVNGYDGIDFNSMPLTAGDLWHAARALLATGVTRFFPTIITNAPSRTIALLEQIHQACLRDRELEQHIPGIHLEGPFISPEDGARGAHDRRYVLPPDYPLFEKMQRAAGGRIRVVTLSPEWKDSSAFIRKCVRTGVKVSIGHTNASPEQIRAAVKAGATMSTHLGNGAALMLPRHPNFIWEQLASDDLTAGIIADGHHVPASFIKTTLRAKPDRVVLVSDATMFAGMPPGVYDSHIGGKVELLSTGRLCIKSNPAMLAGAASPLLSGIEFLVNRDLAPLRTAWSMASVKVNKVTGLSASHRRAAGGDFVVFTYRSGTIHIKKVYKSGRLMFPK